MNFIKNPDIKTSLFTGIFAGLIMLICEWLIPNISYVSLAIILIVSVVFGCWIGNKLFVRKSNKNLPE